MHVPVRIEGLRANGTSYTRVDWLPTDALGVGRIMDNASIPEPQREARAQQHVPRQLGVSDQNDVVMEVSGETYSYYPEGGWKMSTLTTTPHEGQPQKTARLYQPMGSLVAPK